MKEEYDFSESTRNPYIKKLKKQVTIRLEEEVVEPPKISGGRYLLHHHQDLYTVRCTRVVGLRLQQSDSTSAISAF
jgi:hypothetical protein